MKSEMRVLEIIRVLMALSIIAMLTAVLPFDALADDSPVLTVTPDFRDVPAGSGTTMFDGCQHRPRFKGFGRRGK